MGDRVKTDFQNMMKNSVPVKRRINRLQLIIGQPSAHFTDCMPMLSAIVTVEIPHRVIELVIRGRISRVPVEHSFVPLALNVDESPKLDGRWADRPPIGWVCQIPGKSVHPDS